MMRFVQSTLLITWELKQAHGNSVFESPYVIQDDKDLCKKKGKLVKLTRQSLELERVLEVGLGLNLDLKFWTHVPNRPDKFLSLTQA